MNLTTKQLREIALRVARKRGWLEGLDQVAVKYCNELFAEFQKLQDSRIGGLEKCLSMTNTYGKLIAEQRDQLAAKLKALEEQEPVGLVVDDFDGWTKVRMLNPMPCGTRLYAAPVASNIPEGYVLVLKSVLDQFPEINSSNYDHEGACALNAWGVELVLCAQTNPANCIPSMGVNRNV